MIDPGLAGKVALITGGNNPLGIGAATARAFAAQGVSVFIHHLRDSGTQFAEDDEESSPGLPLFQAMQARSAQDVVDEIRAAGGRAACREADLTEPAVVPELFDRAEEALGPVDIVVNNAAAYQADTVLPVQEIEGSDQALWAEGPATQTVTAASHDLHFAVNTRAVVLMMAELARRNLKRGARWGRIVNVSTDSSQGSPREASYSASKHALESYSRGAAAELGPYGINVNVVIPGPIQSGYITKELEEALLPDLPLRRVGKPEDIADAIVFLASAQADWITGQLLAVHGGHRLALG